MTTQGFYIWSTTASTNASVDSSVNFAEGQAPSSLNDSNRAVMARLREFGNDIAGAITTGGSSTAYTVASNQVFDTLAHMNGQVIAFTPHTTNGATVTLNVDGLGAKPLRPAPNVELQSGVLIQGTPYIALYNNSDAVFYLRGVGTAPGVPLGSSFDYWGTSAPSTFFALAFGQAGAKIVACDLNAVGVAERVREFAALGVDARPCAGDLTQPDIAALAVEIALRHFGRLDVVVNVAGGLTTYGLEETGLVDDLSPAHHVRQDPNVRSRSG